MIKVIVSLPLIISIISYIWAKLFQDDDRFPGGPRIHFLLILFQTIIVVTVFLSLQSSLSTYLLSLLYLIQSIGVIYFLSKKGKVSCGCFGSQVSSLLSIKLAIFNIVLSIIPLLFNMPIGLNSFEGVSLLFFLLITVFLLYIGIPDAIYAIKGYTEKGSRYLYFIKK